MNDFLTNIGEHNFLILNYNTFLIQSYGYLKLMEEYGFNNPFSDMHEIDYVVNVLQYVDKNTGKILDRNLPDSEYFNFVKKMFNDITERSYVGNLFQMIEILNGQSFIKSLHIASPTNFTGESLFSSMKMAYFDIFNPDEVVKYMNENEITAVLLHDIELLYQIITNENFDCTGKTFLVSNIGYNYETDTELLTLKCPEVLELRNTKGFLFSTIDLINSEIFFDPFNPIETTIDH